MLLVWEIYYIRRLVDFTRIWKVAEVSDFEVLVGGSYRRLWELFDVGYMINIKIRFFHWSSSGSIIRRSQDGSQRTYCHKSIVSKYDFIDTIRIFQCWWSPIIPKDSIWRGEQYSWITHRYEGTVSLGDSIEIVWCSRSSWSPCGSIRRGEDGSWLTHCYKNTVSVYTPKMATRPHIWTF